MLDTLFPECYINIWCRCLSTNQRFTLQEYSVQSVLT